MLITPLNAFPWVLNGLMEAWVSVQRIQAFLSLKDFDQTEYYLEEPPTETAAHRGKSRMSSELLFNLLYTPPSLPPFPSPSPSPSQFIGSPLALSPVPGTSELIIQDGHFTWRHTNEEEEEGKKEEEQGTDQGESASTCTIGGLSNINLHVQQVNGE